MPVAALAACALAACVLAVPASAGAQTVRHTVSSYRVPVTQPDEVGQSVSLDTDVYLPRAPAPRSGYPLVMVFHGGGSEKSNGFDSGHAAMLADHGYAAILYSARGHGSSDGETTVIGPKEVRDIFDIAAWGLRLGGRTDPAHPDFHLDRGRIALSGYSQGGLHVNLGQVWSDDRSIDPYGLRVRALEPANTPDVTFEALVDRGVVKLTFGLGLVETYLVGARAHMAPEVDKWIATAAADQPSLYGGALCDSAGHDAPTSTMKQDLAWRSPGCRVQRMRPPWLWAQAFDDALFPPDMAIATWRRAPDRRAHLLYLSMGGHAEPAAPAAVEADKFSAQIAFLDHVMRGARLRMPPVTYWVRDPAVAVPANAYAYPPRAWYRRTASTWPPPGTRDVTYQLGADGRAARAGAAAGTTALAAPGEDESHDDVVSAAMSATPLGTSPIPSAIPASKVPGLVAAFATDPFPAARELAGAPVARLAWTPFAPDTQLVLELFDRAPDGTMSLITRGVAGVRGAVPGQAGTVEVPAKTFSQLIRARHQLVARVLAGNVAFYKPYATPVGGMLGTGPASTLTVPLRPPR
jgi:predicted acyl esterase